jgi:hypothetical protein
MLLYSAAVLNHDRTIGSSAVKTYIVRNPKFVFTTYVKSIWPFMSSFRNVILEKVYPNPLQSSPMYVGLIFEGLWSVFVWSLAVYSGGLI